MLSRQRMLDRELREAVKNNSVYNVKSALSQGADPNAIPLLDIPLTEIALRNNASTILKLLLKMGADPNRPVLENATKKTLLHMAIIRNSPECVKALANDSRTIFSKKGHDLQCVGLSTAAKIVMSNLPPPLEFSRQRNLKDIVEILEAALNRRKQKVKTAATVTMSQPRFRTNHLNTRNKFGL